MRILSGFLLVGGLTLAGPPSVWADAAARMAFLAKGRQLMKEDKYAEAVAAFEQAEQADSGDLMTLL